jgi:GNAT superfamily N-acetyltransferase
MTTEVSATEVMRLEGAELAGIRDLFAAVPDSVAAELGVASTEIGGAHCGCVAAAPGSRILNHVVGLGLEREATYTDLDAIDEFYSAYEVGYAVAIAPGTSDLRDRLEGRGFSDDYAWMKFSRTTRSAPTVRTALRVERIGRDHGADFGRIVAAGFDYPPAAGEWLGEVTGRQRWWCFMAFEEDEPAATGALYVDGDVGWLGMAATLPEHRRKGAQNALLAARIEAARTAGCTLLATETGARVEDRPSNSYRNILRADFVEAYERPNLSSAAPEAGVGRRFTRDAS